MQTQPKQENVRKNQQELEAQERERKQAYAFQLRQLAAREICKQ